jgi:hypothetical protein
VHPESVLSYGNGAGRRHDDELCARGPGRRQHALWRCGSVRHGSLGG